MNDGYEFYKKAVSLDKSGYYEEAAREYWTAVLFHNNSPDFLIQDAFLAFMTCYKNLGDIAGGYVYVAKQYAIRGHPDQALLYLGQALQYDAGYAAAKTLKAELTNAKDDDSGGTMMEQVLTLVERGTKYFSDKQWSQAEKVFQEACDISEGQVYLPCTHAIYCRTNFLKWGYLGKQYYEDMETIERITKAERDAFRTSDTSWMRHTSVHPHMMLGYLVPPELQIISSESSTVTEERFAAQKRGISVGQKYNHSGIRHTKYKKDEKIKVAFIGAGFNSKAVLYLSHDMFRFFDHDKFEVHVFSLCDPDNELFIEKAMNGVDWRQRVKDNVDYFWDVKYLQGDHIELGKFIYGKGIHILIDWDGFAREGLRTEGIFPLRSAPIQILHQEFLGTTGSPFIDYIFTDERVSPMKDSHLYSEKFIYMPDHFFSKGHAVQAEILPPSIEYKPRDSVYEYVIGTGSPQENMCGADISMMPNKVAPEFVFCNVHKFLKYNPETLNTWLEVLQRTPGSILCLLKNPPQGVQNLRKYVSDYEGANDVVKSHLNDRIYFLEWEASPFNHQRRNGDLCNVVLDTFPYNGHTTTMDALYAGVPVVTRSDLRHMSARVTTSANIVLGVDDLNGYGLRGYADIAVKLGTDEGYYNSIRRRLVDTALMTEPAMHPFWDVKNYVKNFQIGLEMVWRRYIEDELPSSHIRISDRHYLDDEGNTTAIFGEEYAYIDRDEL